MSLHTWHRQGPCKLSSCPTFMFNSHWGRAATGKNVLYLFMKDCFGSVQTLCDPLDYDLPGFSIGEGVLQARILERIGQYWLPYPSRALYFLLP